MKEQREGEESPHESLRSGVVLGLAARDVKESGIHDGLVRVVQPQSTATGRHRQGPKRVSRPCWVLGRRDKMFFGGGAGS